MRSPPTSVRLTWLAQCDLNSIEWDDERGARRRPARHRRGKPGGARGGDQGRTPAARKTRRRSSLPRVRQTGDDRCRASLQRAGIPAEADRRQCPFPSRRRGPPHPSDADLSHAAEGKPDGQAARRHVIAMLIVAARDELWEAGFPVGARLGGTPHVRWLGVRGGATGGARDRAAGGMDVVLERGRGGTRLLRKSEAPFPADATVVAGEAFLWE